MWAWTKPEAAEDTLQEVSMSATATNPVLTIFVCVCVCEYVSVCEYV